MKHDLYFAFESMREINAFASKVTEQSYFISMNEMTVWKLFSFCRSTCHTAAISGMIGAPPYGAPRNKVDAGSINEAIAMHLNSPVNNYQASREHTNASIDICMIALSYIVRHEFVHIKNGHIDFINGIYGKHFIAEASSSEESIDATTRQTLEMDADAISVGLCIQEALGYWHNTPTPKEIDLTSYLRRHMMGILIGFWTFSANSVTQNMDDWKNKTHPHPLSRLLMCLDVCQVYIERHIPHADAAYVYDNIFVPVCTAFYKSMLELCSSDTVLGDDLARHDFWPYHEELAENLLGRWATIRPKLEPFLLGGTLAPAQRPPR